jgi:hypothetical protein
MSYLLHLGYSRVLGKNYIFCEACRHHRGGGNLGKGRRNSPRGRGGNKASSGRD